MNSFSWQFDKLRKDLNNDDVTYRRMIFVAVLAVILWFGVAWFSDFGVLGWATSGVVVLFISFLNLGMALYSLRFNRSDFELAETAQYIVEEAPNGLRLNNTLVDYSHMVKIVESEFKNVSPLNSQEMIDEGKFLFFILQGSGIDSYSGAVKALKTEEITVVRIPLSYIVEADDCVGFVRDKAAEHGVEYIYENTAIGLQRRLMKCRQESKLDASSKECHKSSLENF